MIKFVVFSIKYILTGSNYKTLKLKIIPKGLISFLTFKKALFFLIFTVCLNSLFACNIPVFLYAMKYWNSGNYRLIIFHEEEFREHETLALDHLSSATNNSSFLNMRDTVIKVTSQEAEQIKLKYQTDILPVMVLLYPEETGITETIWTGELTKANINNIISSTSRSEIIKNLLRGDAIVWLFLESGNKSLDQKFYKILTDNLNKLSDELSLPDTAFDIYGNPIDTYQPQDFKLSFSVTKLSVDNPSEEIFSKILRNSEPDLKFFNSPMAFPVFGKGRTLYALIGEGINENTIRDGCNSIIGWCSCVIKEDNPGTDLLFSANWSDFIDNDWDIDETTLSLTGISGFQKPKGPADSLDLSEKDSLEEKENSSVSSGSSVFSNKVLLRNIIVFVLVFILLVVIISLFIKKKEI